MTPAPRVTLSPPVVAAREPGARGRAHLVDTTISSGPPWSALCGAQLAVSRAAFRAELDLDAPTCRACLRCHRPTWPYVNPPVPVRVKTSRPAPPRDAPT